MDETDLCATDTYSWKQLANEIGRRLYAKGVIATAEARALLPSEEEEVLGTWSGFAYGSNCGSQLASALSEQSTYDVPLDSSAVQNRQGVRFGVEAEAPYDRLIRFD